VAAVPNVLIWTLAPTSEFKKRIKIFIYLRAEFTASGQLQSQHKYKQKTTIRQQRKKDKRLV
jgi:hypothetical protein